MRILVLGGGGREHAIVDCLQRSAHEIYCHPGNAGILQVAAPVPQSFRDASINDPNAMVELARELEIDLCIAGPEAPLAAGVGDAFKVAGLPFFGPTRDGAQLEASKAFAKELMHKHKIPTAQSVTCSDSSAALSAAHDFCERDRGVVIKPSGLTAGKGVTVCGSYEEAAAAIDDIMSSSRYGSAGDSVVVEERMEGQEVSLFCFCDGTTLLPMLPSQDHKRVGDGDTGPNTGGMGAYAPTPFATDELMAAVQRDIIEGIQSALASEGIDYRGVLYIGLMLTVSGPKVVEFNCRFGDPETQVVLPLLTSDLAASCLACCDGNIGKAPPSWSAQTACTVVLASQGYPDKYETGKAIHGLDQCSENVRVYHAGTKQSGDEIVSNGGRVLAITGIDDDLFKAREQAYTAAAKIGFDGAFHRSDIGHHALSASLARS